MLKLSSTWHVPDTRLPDSIDQRYFDVHVPAVRRLPKIRRHVVLKAIPVANGLTRGPLSEVAEHPRFWRGEDIWFDNRQDFDAAVESPEWKAIAAGGIYPRVAELRLDLFDIVEEYRTPDVIGTGDIATGKYIIDRGLWHIPDDQRPDGADQHYFDTHVPVVRRLPSIRRHVVLKGASWPDGRHPRTWRGADCWKEARRLAEDESFDGDEGFGALIAGLEFDRFSVEAEWTPEPDKDGDNTRTSHG